MRLFSWHLFRSLLWLCLLAGPGLLCSEEPKLMLSDDEAGILKLLNQTREEHKLSPLVPHPTLFRVARAHSTNMGKQKKMDHVLDGKKPADRVREAGYEYRIVQENLAFTDDGDGSEPYTLAEVHQGWMKSEKHRNNILHARVKEIGIGVIRLKNGKTYYTQVFGTRLGD